MTTGPILHQCHATRHDGKPFMYTQYLYPGDKCKNCKMTWTITNPPEENK